MADQPQLRRLQKGVEAWNTWRGQHPDIPLDLRGANLSNADLSNADLSEADLSEADLRGTILSKANLRGTILSKANLSEANLSEANLSRTDLSYANLSEADLRGAELFRADLSYAGLIGADLSRADLSYVNLSEANLSEANLSRAYLRRTIFGDVDLRTVRGLDTVRHGGPSTIGTDAISRSEGSIPEEFLRKAGVAESFITSAHALAQNPIEYYTCCISYASKDQEFVERLYTDLQSNSVRCWFAPEDLKIGEKFWHSIDESLRLYDKLLVVLSEHSVNSEWVEGEVMAALEKEQRHHKTALFPITLDETVKQTSLPWATSIRRTRHIRDFTRWKDHEAYQQGLKRLLRDLQPDTRPTSTS
jgi:uncharacterized protein YjbI with pentapeptide repeats